MRIRNDLLAYLGLILLAAAVVIRLAVLDSGTISLILAVLGLATFLVFFFREGRGIQGFLGRRSTREGSGVLTTGAFVLGSVILVNILAAHFRITEDVTADRLFTLSPETEAVLRALPVPPEVWIFQPEGSPQWSQMKILLDAAKEAAPGLVTHFVDPAREPLEAMRFGITSYTNIVQVGDRREPFTETTERAFLEALIRASHPRRAGVAFLMGRGEPFLGENGPQGLHTAADVLRQRGYPVMTLDLGGQGEIPDSINVLIDVGPASDPSPAEETALEQFLDRGGRLFLLLDPAHTARYEALLGPLGLSYVPALLSDPESQDPQILRTPFVSNHPAVAGVRASRLPVVFPGAGRIERTPVQSGVRREVLVRSGRATRVAGEEGEGASRDLVVAAEREGSPGARVVVAADADFVTNRAYGVLGNADLFLGIVRWLAQESVEVNLAPRTATSRPVVMTQQQGRALMVLLVGFLPLGVLGAGTVVWWRRR